MNQKFKLAGTTGYRDSYLEFSFRHFNVFRLHAILHDTARAVWAYNAKGPGYNYMFGQRQNPCLFGHVTGFYVKLFLLSIFNSVGVWSSICWIVPAKDLADKNVKKELGVYIDANVQRYSFCLHKVQTHKTGSLVFKKLHGNVMNSGSLDYNELQNVPPKDMKAGYFAKGTEERKFLSKLVDIE